MSNISLYKGESQWQRDLRFLDELQVGSLGEKTVLLHREHRWVLPLIRIAQSNNVLPTPVTAIIFDRHHDGLEPRNRTKVHEFFDKPVSPDLLVELCKNGLSPLNDDWIKAGMELGIIDNAVVFGSEQRWRIESEGQFTDRRGCEHVIKLCGLPGAELEYKGCLSDLAVSHRHQKLWEILNWHYDNNKVFNFAKDAGTILLDIDLDCFAINWKDYIFPWPNEVFCQEFLKESGHDTTEGWSGKTFFDKLVTRAGLITIAAEPKHCGGPRKSMEILGKVNSYLFDSRLSFETEDEN